MSGPRHALFRIENGDVGLGAARDDDRSGHVTRWVLADQPTPQLVRFGHRRRQADRLQAGDEAAQPRQPERQKMPALRCHQRMQLVEHDIAQVLEEAPRIACGDQQRQLLRRGQKDVGRRQLLSLALVRGRVAGARFDGNRQPDLFHGLGEIALDVDGQRLQRRNVERVDAAMRLPSFRFGRSASSVNEGRNPASVLPAPVGAISSTDCPA